MIIPPHLALSLTTIGPNISACTQGFPPANTVRLPVNVVDRLIVEFAKMVIFKHEDNTDRANLTRLRETEKSNGRCRLSTITDNGGFHYPQNCGAMPMGL